MKILIAGTGALGMLFAAYLSEEHEVQLFGFSKNVDFINNNGIKVLTPHGTKNYKNVRAFSNPKSIENEKFDLLITVVKSFATKDYYDALESVRTNISYALSFQNGIKKEEELINFIGKDRAISSACTIGATFTDKGVVNYTSPGSIWLSLYEKTNSSTKFLEDLSQTFADINFPANIESDPYGLVWNKLVFYSAGAAVGCLTLLPYHMIWSSNSLCKVFLDALKEGKVIAESEGIKLFDMKGLEVISLTTSLSEDEATEILNGKAKQLETKNLKDLRVSMSVDILRQKKTELEFTLGELYHRGVKNKLITPVIHTSYHVVKGLEELYLNKERNFLYKYRLI
ncbi:Ketopantoate reductase ApbA/PanE domain protein [Thermodesulfobium narugense DSM 14796]|uniref:2-dehydropantoate 2-reductase n=1 Tax=Thermodesulfobium narugense DSM 14796 TaxID=747365 RepID=M1E7R2_9BACT|nr:2-dehydropantoate 2-reductase [Thermodesulfobium narugense]AEE14753.1 Ketopantoate reductase ApbA/PanE domain protein [Thermodesulfobium narugense DSM 14796]